MFRRFTILAAALIILTAFAISSEPDTITGSLEADTASAANTWEYNSVPNVPLLTIHANTTISGTITDLIDLKIESGATVTWKAKGAVDSVDDLIVITWDSEGDDFIVDLDDETLSNTGSVLVNYSAVPITGYEGTLRSTATEVYYITLYSKG